MTTVITATIMLSAGRLSITADGLHISAGKNFNGGANKFIGGRQIITAIIVLSADGLHISAGEQF
ncbi:hypothetical protein SPD48_11120 [Pseudogracilibacillus sp. SE30717A]|uniref:hypothetical protein n=1 Tax=Pseudogracilibacillus sp. SE30717A TaxID=3098293 RepID=UPI00300E5AE5